MFQLYLRRHDRIDNWDLVDLAAPHVVGGYLFDRPRDVLYELAASANPWERRTAITATWFFIRKGELDDTFEIGKILVDDDHHFVQTAVGGWLREAGKQDRKRLEAFLDQHAATMPRTTLRFAIEHFEPDVRKAYLGASRDSHPFPARGYGFDGNERGMTMSDSAANEVIDGVRFAHGVFRDLLGKVEDDQWDDPTPSDEWNVRQLVNHVIQGNRWVERNVTEEGVAFPRDDFVGDQDPVDAFDASYRDMMTAIDLAVAEGRLNEWYVAGQSHFSGRER